MSTISAAPESQVQQQQRPAHPEQIMTDSSHVSNGSQPQLRHPGSPQKYPLPESSTFSPVNPQATNLPNPPLPHNSFSVMAPTQEQHYTHEPQNSESLMPQRQPSAVSQVSSLQGSPPVNQGPATAHPSPETNFLVVHAQEANGSAATNQHVSLQRGSVIPEPPVKQAPPVEQELDVPRTSTPPPRAVEEDDIYGATPRGSVRASTPAKHVTMGNDPFVEPESKFASPPVQQIVVGNENSAEPESKFAGPLPDLKGDSKPVTEAAPAQQNSAIDAPPAMVTEPVMAAPVVPQTKKTSSPDPEPEAPSPTESELGHNQTRKTDGAAENSSNGVLNEKPVQSSQEIFEEHKRKQLLRDQEEKIAVFPSEPEMLSLPKKKDDDHIQMTATSYPGQEWNPYGDGGFESD